MIKIRNMKMSDVEKVAELVALDHNATDYEKGYNEAKQHTLDHLKIVPQHCYVIETEDNQIVAVMVLHPQEKVFEIEDFHVKQIEKNRGAWALLKDKLLQYLETVDTEILCCPYAFKRLIKAD
ncbi:MAG: hypothetical protein QW146_09390 [Candidatus Bathyarchaeia archaeon]